MRRRALAVAVPLVLTTGCGHDFEPPDRSAQLQEAAAAYSPAIFDSVSWANDSVRALEGNTVYAEACRRCHGSLGRGETDYARQRGLEIPSLVEPVWPLADLDSLRRIIYVGHEGGMPIFGAEGITPRDIDGAAYYILNVLRPDAMPEGG